MENQINILSLFRYFLFFNQIRNIWSSWPKGWRWAAAWDTAVCDAWPVWPDDGGSHQVGDDAGGGGDGGNADGGDGGDDGGDVMWCWNIKTSITRKILLKGVRSAAVVPEGPPRQPSWDDHSSKI